MFPECIPVAMREVMDLMYHRKQRTENENMIIKCPYNSYCERTWKWNIPKITRRKCAFNFQ